MLCRFTLWSLQILSAIMLDRFRMHLQGIKSVPGVENTVLVQRDGYPITSSGVWLSENEIFGVCASAAAILSVAQRLHNDLSYVLIEGERSKFLLVTLPRATGYFICVTTQNRINLGAILLQLEKVTAQLDEMLCDQDLIPPLRTFEDSEKQSICQSFDVRENHGEHWSTGTINLSITDNIATEINAIVEEFLATIPSAQTGVVCLDGGYLIPTININENARIRKTTLAYTLFDTSKRVAQLVKRTRILCVLCDCNNTQHFIYRIAGGLFSTLILKDTTRLGLLRLLIPNFIAEIEAVLQKAPLAQRPSLDIDGFLGVIAK
jgi:predicted regulator of Ras-like GTPase activity (Roadblock/LC7/MglB family)